MRGFVDSGKRKRSKFTYAIYNSVLGDFFSEFSAETFTVDDANGFLEGVVIGATRLRITF